MEVCLISFLGFSMSSLAKEFIDFSTFRIELNPHYQRQRMQLRDGVAQDAVETEQASWTLLPNLGIQIVGGGYLMTSQRSASIGRHCEVIK